MKGTQDKKVFTFNDVLDLRQVVEALSLELPHLSFLLELVILGMSKTAISKLTLNSIKDNKIHWQNRRNVKIVSELSERQITVMQEYLHWRKSRRVNHNFLLLVKQSSYFTDGRYSPIKAERVRSDIRFIGREIGLTYGLEIPAIHKAVSNHLLAHNINKEKIKKSYKLY